MARAFLGLLIVAMIGVTGFYTYHHVGCPNGGCSAAVSAPEKSSCCSEQTDSPCCPSSAKDGCSAECPAATAGKCCMEKETKETKVEAPVTPK